VTFLDLVWPVCVAVAILWGLGGALAAAVGLRGFWAVGAAPAFALTIIGGTAVVAGWVGVPWSLLPVAGMTALVGGAILLIRRRADRGTAPARRPRRRPDWWLVAALAAAAVITIVRVAQIIQAPDHISQTFDNIFHLNGVRFILDEGNASSLRLGYMTSPDGSLPFYPAAWHALVSLTVQLSGATIPVAVNAVVMVVAAVVWPVAVVLLVRALFGRHPALTVGAALLAVSLPTFPLLPMDYGVLYPFQLGLAVLPVALAATLRVLSIVPRRDPAGLWWWLLILLGAIPGMALGHPGAFVAWLALTVPMAIVFIVDRWRVSTTMKGRLLVAAGVIAYLGIGVVLVRILRPPLEARLWPTQMSVPEAAWQVLSASTWYLAPAFVAAVAILAGAVWAVIDRTRPAIVALGLWVVGAVLFITVASLPFGDLRDLLTGSWYNNLPRLAAILAIASVPIGAYGVARTWVAVTALPPVRRAARSLPRAARVTVAAVLAVLLGLSMQGLAVQRAVDWAKPLYLLYPGSPLLTSDEYALLQRVPEHVPEDVAIAGSPWTGASLASAISGRDVLMPHTLMQISDELETINDGLDSAGSGGDVCRAVTDLGVGFVLDFGTQEVHPGTHPFPGLDDLEDSDAVRLVDSEGDVRLYEIVACG
jgi:hypothetical protein